ncbi:MAG TPA: M50 family metallopeptidase [Terriglobales bacterium]
MEQSATPILDSGILPQRHRRGIRPKALGGALLIGVVLMEILALLGGLWHEHWPAIFLALFILAITIHEVGHLVAGWVVGFHFSSIQVGPLMLENEYGVLRSRLSFDMMAFGSAGMYANGVRKLRRRSIVYIAGGPAANLLTVVVVVLVSYLIPSTSSSGLATAAGQLAAISLLLAMISLVPITSNDGAIIEMLLFSPFSARRYISTVALGSQFNQGIRAGLWKQTWVKAATYIPDKSHNEFYASWMAYLFANDRKNGALAAQYLERCLEITPSLTTMFRDLVAQEAVVFISWFKTDPTLAEKWLLQVKQRRSLPQLLQVRIEVALHCSRRDFDSALGAWEKGCGLVDKTPVKPSNASLRESWLEWRSEIQERQAQMTA